MLNKNYAIMEQKEKNVSIKVTEYEAGKIYSVLMLKGVRFKEAKLPDIAKHYFRIAEKILKQIESCVNKD